MSFVNKCILIGLVEGIETFSNRGLKGILLNLSASIVDRSAYKSQAKENGYKADVQKVLLIDSIADYANKVLKTGDCIYLEATLKTTILLDDNLVGYSTSVPHVRSLQILSSKVNNQSDGCIRNIKHPNDSIPAFDYDEFQQDFDEEYRQA